jgi:hypothetical protein
VEIRPQINLEWIFEQGIWKNQALESIIIRLGLFSQTCFRPTGAFTYSLNDQESQMHKLYAGILHSPTGRSRRSGGR